MVSREGNYPLESNWALRLSLIVFTIAAHATGIAVMALAVLRVEERVERHAHLTVLHHLLILIVLISAVGLLLAGLHGAEAVLWAAAYWWLGAFGSPSEAILYSVDSMSTRGASGLMLEHGWRMMRALEETDGMLLFGISTAFIFAVMLGYWPIMTQKLKHRTNAARKPRQ